MAISGFGNNYGNVYEGTYAAQKNEAAKKAETGMTNAERMKKNMDERLEKQKEKLEDAYYPKFDMNV